MSDMKTKLSTAFLIAFLCLCMLLASGCSEPASEEWTPTGADVTLLQTSDPAKYFLVYANEELDLTAATSLKTAFSEKGFTLAPVVPATTEARECEILFGETDREASAIAIEYFNEKYSEADGHAYVIYYRDGKLAFYANSTEGYAIALNDFMAKYVTDTTVAFKDTLKEYSSITLDDYSEYLLDVRFEEYEAQREKNEGNLPALLDKVTAQREDIASSGIFGTSTKNLGAQSWGVVETKPTEDHPRLLLNKNTLNDVALKFATDEATNERLRKNIAYMIVNDAILPEPIFHGTNTTVDIDNVHNFNSEYLEIIQSKALGYLIYDDEYLGYEAILYIKNYIKSLDIVQIASDQCRQYGSVMFTAAIVYDWCYDLLTEEDKEQIIAGVENKICRGKNEAGAKMEVGFPPSGQGSVTGHGSERQVLRDYLGFAVAIYGDNNSWYDYVAARVYYAYAPPRNYYYQSGIVHQGTGYATGRYVSDLFSAWILYAATGEHPYVGMKDVTRGIMQLEFNTKQLFNDGDKTGDYASTSGFSNVYFITAYMFEDETILAHAEELKGKSAFSDNFNGLTSATFAALRGISDVTAADSKYEDMNLIHYYDAPLGQYVVRAGWGDESSAAVLMRIKERATGNHEHKDAGTFEIYYKGMLTSDGGCYNNYGHEHTQYFHHATISHNGLILFNSSKWNGKASSGSSKWYSGGQRGVGEPSSYAALMTSTYVTGKVTGRQHAYTDETESSPLYAYIAGDITAAYPSDDADYVGRRMLTVYTGDEEYPMAFFVYDDVESSKSTIEKRFLLQITSPNAPTVDEKAGTVITDNKNGRLVLTCLSKDVSINMVGGRNSGKYSAKDSSNYLINGAQCIPKSNTADDGHWGRIEIVYTEKNTVATFMNVMYVTDAGNNNIAKVKKISGSNGVVEGGVFENSIVGAFVTDRNRRSTEFSFKTSGSGTMSYYVSGVAEGSWTVSVDGKSCGTFTATAEGGLLTFSAPAGDVVIAPAK